VSNSATGRQEGTTTARPATHSAHAAFAETLAMNPLLAQSAAAMAAATAVGMSIAGQFAGAFFGALQGALETQNRRSAATAPKTDMPEPKTAPAATAAPAEPAVKAKRKKAAAVARPAAKRTRSAAKDDLKGISGIGPKLEKVLNEQGITRISQIAAWGEADVASFDQALGLDGRIGRDDWVGQARKLAEQFTPGRGRGLSTGRK